MDIETVIIKEEPGWEDDVDPKPKIPRVRHAVIRRRVNHLQTTLSDSNSKIKRRSDNWTFEDKMLLKVLVKQKEEIIENKQTDTETNEKKQAAWIELQSHFNLSCNGPSRTVNQLRIQWGAIKSAERRNARIPKLGQKTSAPAEDCNGSSRSQDETDSDNNRAPLEEKLGVGPARIKVVPQTRTIQITPLERRQEVRQQYEVRRNEQLRTASVDVATVEIRCREQLHRAQMANERRRQRNLDLKERLLLAKIQYFEQKTKEIP